MELEALILEQGVMIDDIQRHLKQIDKDLHEVLALLRPVSEHADWVEHLRQKLDRWNILRNVPKLECQNSEGGCDHAPPPWSSQAPPSPSPSPLPSLPVEEIN